MKFGNLNSVELGKPSVSVRDQSEIACYLEAEGLDKLADYFRTKSEITLSSSLSKNGKLIDNIVTQIKKEQKETREPTAEVKRNIFGKAKRQEVIPE